MGKTAIVEGLAQLIAGGNVPDILRGKQIWTLDLASLVAGSKYRGEFEERMKKVVRELQDSKEDILFIDEIHTVIGAGSAEGSIDAASILKPPLSRGEIQVIGATTAEEYRKHVEKDSAFERRFQPVNIGEPSPEDAIKIIEGLKERYEKHHHVRYTDAAVKAAVTLSSRYVQDRFLPDKAIDVLDEAGARTRVHKMALPPEIAQTDADLARVRDEKSAAAAAQEFRGGGSPARRGEGARGPPRRARGQVARGAGRQRGDRRRGRHRRRGLHDDRRARLEPYRGRGPPSSCAARTCSTSASWARTRP